MIKSAFTNLAIFVALVSVISSASAWCPKYTVKVVTGTSHDADGLKGTVDKYRKLLGGEDNGNDPPTGGVGQRSINWDAAAVPFDMPFDFFNKQVPRGAVFFAKDYKFAVSNPAEYHPKDDRFNSIIPNFISKMFVRFSLERLFSPVNDNKFKTVFEIPGKRGVRANTRGFGAVFTDVDWYGKTVMKYFDSNGCFIAKVKVPAKSKGLSFAGIVVFDGYYKQLPVIAKVNIKLGTISLRDVAKFFDWYWKKLSGDVVVADDFIYGEPVNFKKY